MKTLLLTTTIALAISTAFLALENQKLRYSLDSCNAMAERCLDRIDRFIAEKEVKP